MDTNIIRTGRIATYNAEKGYGFIYEDTKDNRLHSYFFHVSSCLCEPKPELKVQFRSGQGKKGLSAVALDVNVLRAPSVADILNTVSSKSGETR